MANERETTSISRIELRVERENSKPVLLIDGVETNYGQFSDGLYYLHEDAYRRSYDLNELALDHERYRRRVVELRRRANEAEAEGGLNGDAQEQFESHE